MHKRQEPQVRPGSAPATFPVSWEQPGDANLFWRQERQHYPDPILPLRFSLDAVAFPYGLLAAAGRYHLPIAEMRVRRINTYVYGALVPLQETSVNRAARGRRAQETLITVIGGLGEWWHEHWLPSVKDHLAFWNAFDLPRADKVAFQAHVEETLSRYRALWKIHAQIALPVAFAVSHFDDFYRDLFPRSMHFAPYDLLRGFESKTLERDRWMWRLSRRALASAVVRDVFLLEKVLGLEPALQQSAAGRVFLAELDNLLAEFGASWSGNRLTPLAIIQAYVRQPERDLEAKLAELARQREEAIARTTHALASHSPAVREKFHFLLRGAQQATVLHEDHAYWIDQLGTEHVLAVFRECGHRLAKAGVLAEPGDVMYLALEEVRAALATPLASLAETVEARRAEMVHFAQIKPPPVLGTPPAGPPPVDPISRALARVSGAPLPSTTVTRTIQGYPASAGQVQGVVRLLHSPAEAARLQPGEILVAPTTTPTWTPLFATAAAVVTDTGGILSHCAAVAREYGLPAVVGTGNATTRLRDGQPVQVDGTRGTVLILS